MTIDKKVINIHTIISDFVCAYDFKHYSDVQHDEKFIKDVKNCIAGIHDRGNKAEVQIQNGYASGDFYHIAYIFELQGKTTTTTSKK